MLIIANDDQPGVIGEVGTILGRHAVNIANFALGRGESGAIGVVNVDEEVGAPRPCSTPRSTNCGAFRPSARPGSSASPEGRGARCHAGVPRGHEGPGLARAATHGGVRLAHRDAQRAGCTRALRCVPPWTGSPSTWKSIGSSDSMVTSCYPPGRAAPDAVHGPVEQPRQVTERRDPGPLFQHDQVQ